MIKRTTNPPATGADRLTSPSTVSDRTACSSGQPDHGLVVHYCADLCVFVSSTGDELSATRVSNVEDSGQLLWVNSVPLGVWGITRHYDGRSLLTSSPSGEIANIDIETGEYQFCAPICHRGRKTGTAASCLSCERHRRPTFA